MPITRVIIVDGKLLMGVDKILAGQNKLPEVLQIVRLPGITGEMHITDLIRRINQTVTLRVKM